MDPERMAPSSRLHFHIGIHMGSERMDLSYWISYGIAAKTTFQCAHKAPEIVNFLWNLIENNISVCRVAV